MKKDITAGEGCRGVGLMFERCGAKSIAYIVQKSGAEVSAAALRDHPANSRLRCRPIYVGAAFSLVFELQASTYAACYVLAKVGRPGFALPEASEFLFQTPRLLWLEDIASSYPDLCLI